MANVALVGVDSAGALITGQMQSRRFSNGSPWSVVGDSVTPHGGGLHGAPVMAEGSGRHFVDGIAVCRAGDAANCGHTASGSSQWDIEG